MKIKLTFTLIFFCALIPRVSSQNFIPNPSFEQRTICSPNGGLFSDLDSWTNPTSAGSPDYYHTCSSNSPSNSVGVQQPQQGSGYVGLLLYPGDQPLPANSRDYIQTPLTASLLPGECYLFRMYLSLAEAANITTDNIGVYFSTSAFSAPGPLLTFTPQFAGDGHFPDDDYWVSSSAMYDAVGGERYITIGNFSSDALTPTMTIKSSSLNMIYVYIDNVTLIPCSSLGIKDLNAQSVGVFPTLCTDVLKMSSKTEHSYILTLFDQLNHVVIEREMRAGSELSVVDLPAGVYYCLIQGPEGDKYYRKIVKN